MITSLKCCTRLRRKVLTSAYQDSEYYSASEKFSWSCWHHFPPKSTKMYAVLNCNSFQVSGTAFYFGLQIYFTRNRHPIFFPEAGKNRHKQETCCCAIAGIRIIVFTWKNYFGECQRERCNHNELQLWKCAKSSPQPKNCWLWFWNTSIYAAKARFLMITWEDRWKCSQFLPTLWEHLWILWLFREET